MTTFLAWAASPEHDERKLMGIKGITIISIMWAFALYHKRLRWVSEQRVEQGAVRGICHDAWLLAAEMFQQMEAAACSKAAA